MVKWRSLLIGGAISAVCIVLVVRSVDFAQVGAAFAQADPVWIALALATIALSLAMRVWKWQLLLLPDDRVSFWNAGSATLIGYMFNTVLPGRVGELARAALVGQSDGVSAARAIGTIFIEKVLDVLMLLLLLGALTLLMPLPAFITSAGVLAAVVFGGMAIAFFASIGFRTRIVGWMAQRVDPLPGARRLQPSRLVDKLLRSATSLGRPRLLVLQLVGSLLLWIGAFLTAVCVLRAFHVDVPLTAALTLIVTTNLGMTVPAAPGSIGVYEYVVQLTLGLPLFGVDSNAATAVGLTLHVLGFGSFTLAGAIILLAGLARQRYSLTDLFRVRSAAPDLPTVPAPTPAHGTREAAPVQLAPAATRVR